MAQGTQHTDKCIAEVEFFRQDQQKHHRNRYKTACGTHAGSGKSPGEQGKTALEHSQCIGLPPSQEEYTVHGDNIGKPQLDAGRESRDSDHRLHIAQHHCQCEHQSHQDGLPHTGAAVCRAISHRFLSRFSCYCQSI